MSLELTKEKNKICNLGYVDLHLNQGVNAL